MSDDLPTAEEIIDTHVFIEEEYELKFRGARVAAPQLKLKRLLRDISDDDDTEDIYLRAAALLRHIITAHYFEDGNKRTAWLTAREYLERHGEIPAERGELAHRVLKNVRRFDVDELAEWLQSGEIDEKRLTP
ncbi:Fic family protein [Halegenticoccus tardaugens]|uniref:Fic family protein n=1 Tax=Halegenticoccus tardaugens TaxID=2071624 RepID=UPI00100A4778|nr:Fic family protein [Halegenticoccus tardaugens]